MTKIFISYAHEQGPWVWRYLVPVLKAAGADLLIDVERFKYGVSVPRQMNEAQDEAEYQLLCFSRAYFQSSYCDHEWRRAVASDPAFSSGKIIPLKMEQVDLPAEIQQSNPLFGKLHRLDDPMPWRKLIVSVNLNSSWCPLSWLNASVEISDKMKDTIPVNLVVDDHVEVDTLLKHLVAQEMPTPLLPKLQRVSLADFQCATCTGFLNLILQRLNIQTPLPYEKLAATAEFGAAIRRVDKAFLALEKFDMVQDKDRQEEYGHNLFSGLYALTTDRILSLLVISRKPYARLVPKEHPISNIPFHMVELKRLS